MTNFDMLLILYSIFVLLVMIGNKIIDYLLYYQILENPKMMVLDVDIDHFEIRKDTIPFHCIWIKN